MTAPVPPLLKRWQIPCPIKEVLRSDHPIECSWCAGTLFASVYLAAEVEARDIERNIQLTDARAEVTRLEAERDEAVSLRTQWAIDADSLQSRVDELTADLAVARADCRTMIKTRDDAESLRAETVALRAALKGMLRQLPDLWGDHVRGGHLSLRVDEEDIDAALRAALLAADQGETR